MTDTAATKKHLRTEQRALLATLDQTQSDDAHLVCHTATAQLELYPTIAFYQPLPGELDPLPLLVALAAHGTITALPRVASENAPLVFHRWSVGDALMPDALGIAAPASDALTIIPSLVVAPLLAFDRVGNRLGKGGGYYDRTINQLRAENHRVAYAGLGYAEQQVPEVPAEPHDARLDFIITPAGILRFTMLDKIS